MLFPPSLCDTLLRAAAAALYQVLWSDRILRELEEAMIRELQIDPLHAKKRISAMKAHFPEAMVTGFENLIPAMLNDADDRHVAAAAVAAGAQVIVTNNLRHFRKGDLPASGQAQSPDEFLTSLLSFRPAVVLDILTAQAGDLKRPPMTVLELLEGLARSTPKFAEAAKELVTGAKAP